MYRFIEKLNKCKFISLVLILAAMVRFFALTEVPPSLNWDEVSHGYNAYSILKTGRDEWGQLLPVIFRAYGDYKLPVYIYLTTPSILIFGLNTFSVRLVSALAGLVTVLFTYLLTVELFGHKKRLLGTLAAILVSVEPWSLFLSRAAFEANLAVAFITVGIYFLVKSVNNAKHFLISIIFFGLSVWTYNSARIFVPLFLSIYLIFERRKIISLFINNRKIIIVSFIFSAIFFLPMFYQLVKPIGQARYGKVAIIDDGAIGQIIEARNNSKLPATFKRFLYNRPSYFIVKFLNNWFQHFSGNFLYFTGGDNYQFSIPERGILYPLNIIFLIIGIVGLIRRRDRATFILLLWFYLAPVASSLTREAPHVLRSSLILPTPMLISAYGFVGFTSYISKKFLGGRRFAVRIILALYLLLLLISLSGYLKDYFGGYRTDYSWSWQYGYRQVVSYAKEHYYDYDRIIITKMYGEPHEFTLFYWPWPPGQYQNDSNLIRFNKSNWYWVDGFDKFYFVNDWEIPTEEWQDFVIESGRTFNCQDTLCLLITSPGNFPKTWNKLREINFLNGEIAFEIYENSNAYALK